MLSQPLGITLHLPIRKEGNAAIRQGITPGENSNTGCTCRKVPRRSVSPSRNVNVLRKQLRDLVAHILLQMRIEIAARAAGKASVDRTHQAISPDDECRGPGVQVFRLWDLLVQLTWFSRDQVGVFDSVALDERPDTGKT